MGDSSVVELESALNEVLDIHDDQELVSGCFPPSGGDEIYQSDDKMSGELKIHQPNSLVSTTQKGLTKSMTFPCSGITCSAYMDGREEITGATLHGHTEPWNPACTRSLSLPTSLKLVSAMKGSREKQGIALKKLNVTWASDVFDPPATSLSRTTVKSHIHHHSRGNKKNGKGKHKHKGKSSRGSDGEKKQYRKVVTDTHCKPPVGERLLLGGFCQSSVELVDLAVTGQESKCGSSFLRTSLAKQHYLGCGGYINIISLPYSLPHGHSV
ncbi:PREDICTED: uncharacterized protein LOC104599303 isoform X2 [Nelumbo nucifera]|uniref:Uncharacterized protein LOC104599303 isoform X2 n=1 Tax=Nelumbo nucifera TaxID=4432 RepID=A0A1U8AD37_NELNU|nr:PREDICTED: uncharacterized protein LOC104599303 isoform X2 [Nelumbo nucifera]